MGVPGRVNVPYVTRDFASVIEFCRELSSLLRIDNHPATAALGTSVAGVLDLQTATIRLEPFRKGGRSENSAFEFGINTS